jgi:hypothetical protein
VETSHNRQNTAMGSEMFAGKLTERQCCRGEEDIEYFDVILFEK